MNCPTADKLSQYNDALLPQQESSQIHAHIQSCRHCQLLLEAFANEEQFLKETLQSPELPEEFADTVLNQLQPYEQPAAPRKLWKKAVLPAPGKKVWKKTMLSAAGLVLAIGLGSSLNPSFAQWIGGLFSTDQVDEGLRLAADEGFAHRVNLEAEDHGLTFKVEDIVADSTRIALSYQILNKKGKPQDLYLDLQDGKNEVYALDKKGARIEVSGMSWGNADDYGVIEFSLREQKELEQLTVKFDLTELNGKNGSWQLEVPVDLKDSLKSTTILTFSDTETSRHGVNIAMKEVQYAPSSNELVYETSFTEEERSKFEAQIKGLEERFGKEKAGTFANYGTAIQYHLENEENKTVYQHNTFLKGKGHTSDVGMLQGMGENLATVGHMRWNESFIPQKGEERLTFVLDGVVKTVPADFTVKIKPKELKKNPLSLEYEGNFLSVKKAAKESRYSLRKALLPIQKETIFKIEMEGGKEAPSSEFGAWLLEDDKGNHYTAYHSGSILDEKDENGRYKTTIDLTVYGMDEVPEELTLHLLSVTRYHEVEDEWRVPLK
ncbi:DUF4179 domain-containing protein [Bacillus sp. FJAT-27251]|uniref:DUF4179 domain-containing protein n=1 Tax=Bacillus sp. FJAT-27251 TaxID=1684142 RepID=UPI0006A785B9|nr:DUF4179 domain-containing protein [Bacillus sp. FJAT-27251]